MKAMEKERKDHVITFPKRSRRVLEGRESLPLPAYRLSPPLAHVLTLSAMATDNTTNLPSVPLDTLEGPVVRPEFIALKTAIEHDWPLVKRSTK
jgi:hypothetical protein